MKEQNDEEIIVINWSKKEDAMKKLEQDKIFRELGIEVFE